VQRVILLVVVGALALAGCGDGDQSATTTATGTTTVAEPTRTSTVLVYFLRDGKVAAARRSVEHTGAVAAAAIRALIEGPTAEEADAGLATAVVPETRLRSLSIVNGTARIGLDQPEIEEEDVVTTASVAQIVYTLTQFPNVRGVVYEGTRVLGPGLTRKDMEEWTPAIFVESPVVGETVQSPVRVTGTANTFEANFILRLEARGKKVAERFVTATSGNGVRGTFDATIAAPATATGSVTLVAFEPSAADGRPRHVVRIPLRLQ
jgi:germination protein M